MRKNELQDHAQKPCLKTLAYSSASDSVKSKRIRRKNCPNHYVNFCLLKKVGWHKVGYLGAGAASKFSPGAEAASTLCGSRNTDMDASISFPEPEPHKNDAVLQQ
jgi:hypothetical protein